MKRPTFIVDTSALVDTVQMGSDAWANAFAHVQSKYDVIAPLRVVYEVGNIVHRKHPNVFGKDLKERQQVVSEILQGVRIVPWEPSSVPRAGELAEKHNVTFYDATFLDLAHQTRDSILLVQDEKLHEGAAKLLGEGRVHNLDELANAVSAKKY